MDPAILLSTPEAIETAAKDGVGVVVTPIAFVSEHVETLVELDIEYAQLAQKLALPFYLRAPTPGVAPRFIDALATLAERALAAMVNALKQGQEARPTAEVPA